MAKTSSGRSPIDQKDAKNKAHSAPPELSGAGASGLRRLGWQRAKGRTPPYLPVGHWRGAREDNYREGARDMVEVIHSSELSSGARELTNII
jgi:hypothetical protein